MIVGSLLIFLAVLVAFAKKDYLNTFLEPAFGPHFRWIFSPVAGLTGLRMVIGKNYFDVRRTFGLIIFWLTSVSLWAYFSDSVEKTFFFDVHEPLVTWIDTIPTVVLLIVGWLFSLYLLFHISYSRLVSRASEVGSSAMKKQVEALNTLGDNLRERQNEREKAMTEKQKQRHEELSKKIEKLSPERVPEAPKKSFFEKIRTQGTIPAKPESTKTTQPIPGARSIPIQSNRKEPLVFKGNWVYPSSSLLKQHKKIAGLSKEEIELRSAIIERTLLQFGIEVHMAGYEVGPTVTQYRLKPSEGVKLGKIESLKKDLTLALKAKNIRIQAPIP